MKSTYAVVVLTALTLIVLALAWWGLEASGREHGELRAAMDDLSWRLAVLEQADAPGGVGARPLRDPSPVQTALVGQVQDLARRVAEVERVSARLDEINGAVQRLERDTGQAALRQSLSQVRQDTARLDRRVDDLERSARADEASPDLRELQHDVRELLRDVEQLGRDLESLERRVAQIERDL